MLFYSLSNLEDVYLKLKFKKHTLAERIMLILNLKSQEKKFLTSGISHAVCIFHPILLCLKRLQLMAVGSTVT